MLPVSISLRRTRQGCSASGSMTRHPSLKSKRMPAGPSWVGISAAAGYARLGAEPEELACVADDGCGVAVALEAAASSLSDAAVPEDARNNAPPTSMTFISGNLP